MIEGGDVDNTCLYCKTDFNMYIEQPMGLYGNEEKQGYRCKIQQVHVRHKASWDIGGSFLVTHLLKTGSLQANSEERIFFLTKEWNFSLSPTLSTIFPLHEPARNLWLYSNISSHQRLISSRLESSRCISAGKWSNKLGVRYPTVKVHKAPLDIIRHGTMQCCFHPDGYKSTAKTNQRPQETTQKCRPSSSPKISWWAIRV